VRADDRECAREYDRSGFRHDHGRRSMTQVFDHGGDAHRDGCCECGVRGDVYSHGGGRDGYGPPKSPPRPLHYLHPPAHSQPIQTQSPHNQQAYEYYHSPTPKNSYKSHIPFGPP